MTNTFTPSPKPSIEQDQFLTILSREEALARFDAALFPRPLPSETQQDPHRGANPVGQFNSKGWIEIGADALNSGWKFFGEPCRSPAAMKDKTSAIAPNVATF